MPSFPSERLRPTVSIPPYQQGPGLFQAGTAGQRSEARENLFPEYVRRLPLETYRLPQAWTAGPWDEAS